MAATQHSTVVDLFEIIFADFFVSFKGYLDHNFAKVSF